MKQMFSNRNVVLASFLILLSATAAFSEISPEQIADSIQERNAKITSYHSIVREEVLLDGQLDEKVITEAVWQNGMKLIVQESGKAPDFVASKHYIAFDGQETRECTNPDAGAQTTPGFQTTLVAQDFNIFETISFFYTREDGSPQWKSVRLENLVRRCELISVNGNLYTVGLNTPDGSPRQRAVLDASKGFQLVEFRDIRPHSRAEMKFELQELAEGIWFPKEGTWAIHLNPENWEEVSRLHKFQVECEMNVDYPPDLFQLVFPDGEYIWDHESDITFLKGATLLDLESIGKAPRTDSLPEGN
ncbi:hypothetical protein KQI84_08600 [bacterium]|nr:hypothetical protein [bacterium]